MRVLGSLALKIGGSTGIHSVVGIQSPRTWLGVAQGSAEELRPLQAHCSAVAGATVEAKCTGNLELGLA